MEKNEIVTFEKQLTKIKKVVERVEKSYEGYRTIMWDVEAIYKNKNVYKEAGKNFADFMLENTGMGKSTAYSLVKIASGLREITEAVGEKVNDINAFIEDCTFRELIALTKDSKFVVERLETSENEGDVIELLNAAISGGVVAQIESKESDATYTDTDSIVDNENEEEVENSDVGNDELKIEITTDADGLHDRMHEMLNTIRKSGKTEINIKISLRK